MLYGNSSHKAVDSCCCCQHAVDMWTVAIAVSMVNIVAIAVGVMKIVAVAMPACCRHVGLLEHGI